MSSYHFSVNGHGLVTLYENDDPLYVVTGENTAAFFVDDRSGTQYLSEFTPTSEFWRALVHVNEETSKLTQAVKHIHLPDEVVPPIEEWKVPYFPQLPKYERKIVTNITYMLVDYRMETNAVFREHPELRRLFRAAHAEARREVPEYLTESFC